MLAAQFITIGKVTVLPVAPLKAKEKDIENEVDNYEKKKNPNLKHN